MDLTASVFAFSSVFGVARGVSGGGVVCSFSGVTSAVAGKMVASTTSGGVGSGVLMSLAVNQSVASTMPCRAPLRSVFFLLRCELIDLGIGG